MKISEFTAGNSDYMTQYDADPPVTLTILRSSVDQVEDKAKQSRKPKVVIYWVEDMKPWIASLTDRRTLAAMFPGAEDSKHYIGVRLTLHRDPTVRFGNGRNAEVCGGIRIMGSPDIDPSVESVKIKLGTSSRMTTIALKHTVAPDPLVAACEAIGVDLAALSEEVQSSTGYKRARSAYALRHLPPERVAALKARASQE